MNCYKFCIRCVFSLLLLSLLFSCSKEDENEVVVYAYSSLASEWGLGAKVATMYEEKYGTKVRFITFKDAGGMLFDAIKEKNNAKADVILGLDNNMVLKALKQGILISYKPEGYEKIRAEFIMNKDAFITPFDYGYFAFMYNTESDIAPPASMSDLMDEKYKDRLIIMNPATSAPGLGALLWIHKIYGDSYLDAWKRIAGNSLSMPTSWSQGYSMFTAGEVPLAISYTTSLAAHVLYDNTSKFQPLMFEEGHLLQLEGMAILNGAKHIEAAEKFMNFMLSEEVQSLICETQFMFPIIESVSLASSFETVPHPNKILKEDSEDIDLIVKDALNAIN